MSTSTTDDRPIFRTSTRISGRSIRSLLTSPRKVPRRDKGAFGLAWVSAFSRTTNCWTTLVDPWLAIVGAITRPLLASSRYVFQAKYAAAPAAINVAAPTADRTHVAITRCSVATAVRRSSAKNSVKHATPRGLPAAHRRYIGSCSVSLTATVSPTRTVAYPTRNAASRAARAILAYPVFPRGTLL